jgi:hypothetical protein
VALTGTSNTFPEYQLRWATAGYLPANAGPAALRQVYADVNARDRHGVTVLANVMASAPLIWPIVCDLWEQIE